MCATAQPTPASADPVSYYCGNTYQKKLQIPNYIRVSARKVKLGLGYLSILGLGAGQGGYQSVIYQHTFSTDPHDYLKTKTTLRCCLGNEPKNHVELRERIHSFTSPRFAASVHC